MTAANPKTLTKEHEKYLAQRLITKEIAAKYGLYSAGDKIVIPTDGPARVYNPTGSPKIRWASETDDTLPPFPSWEALKTAEVLVEGEFDCILARELGGLNAASGTAGAGTFLYEWADTLSSGVGQVTILYDNDEAGVKGARSAAKTLIERGVQPKIAKWGQRGNPAPKGYDITDYFKAGGTAEGLRIILGQARVFDGTETDSGPQGFGEMYADLADDPIVPTGFQNIDEIIYGLRKQELAVLSARPKIGKSTLAIQIAVNIAKTGKTALVFSMEMSEQQVLERIIAGEAGIPKQHLERGMGDVDIDRLYRYLPNIWSLPLRLDTRAKLSVKDIYNSSRLVSKTGQLGLIVVDYTQLLDTSEKAETRARQLAAAVEDLKGLAKEMDCPVLALSQVNRAGASNEEWQDEPQLHNLAESGGFENNADLVLMLWRERKEEKEAIQNKLDIPTHGKVAKNRNGAEGYFDLKLDGPKFQFWEDTV